MFKQILIICIVIITVGTSQTTSKYVKEILPCEMENKVSQFTPLLDSIDFGNDVRITNDYTPHKWVSIASYYVLDETYCAFSATYNGYPAVMIYKTTDGGHNWIYFGGIYTPGGEPIPNNSIAVTQNYVCLAYTIATSGEWGTVETYRKPRSGGSGVFTDLPPTPAGRPDVTGIEGWAIYGDTVDLVLAYHYSSSNEAIVFFQSPDGGVSWIKEYTFELGTSVTWPSISHCSQWHNIYIAWLSYGTGELRLARSTDSGSNWQTQTLDSYAISHNVGLCSYGQFVYVFASFGGPNPGGRVYVSYDYASTWQTGNLTNSYDHYAAEFANAALVSGYFYSDQSIKFCYGTTISDFTGVWTRINDASAAVYFGCDLCGDANAGAVVAWSDNREGGVNKAFCDGQYWTGIEEDKNQAITSNGNFFLTQNYPNPVCSKSILRYSIPKECNVKLEIFDVTGRQIAVLVNESQKPGCYQVNWDIRNVSEAQLTNGVYFYRLTAGDYTNTKKLVIVR
ncbi:MAG: T9SS type A sorting domain-containing protein [Candidatus Helarchaeota archaeon]